jgi:hypothetical protein
MQQGVRMRQFTSYPLLSRDECAAVSGELDTVAADWHLRWATTDWLSTLGTAAYLDLRDEAKRPTDKYYRLAAKYNPVLREHFGPLHARVREALAEIVDAPVRLADRFGLPGFHIFGPGILARPFFSSPHFDMQYLQLDHSGLGEPAVEESISFNILIEAPAEGAGLRTWDAFAPDVDRAVAAGTISGYQDVANTQNSTDRRYVHGELNVHSGLQLHMIVPTQHIEPTTRRITLQGHAMRYGAEWLLYW